MRVRITLLVLLAILACAYLRVHVSNRVVASLADTDENLARIVAQAKPLIDALDRYHSRHGSYPTSLAALAPDLSTPWRFRGYVYGGGPFNRIYRSPACADRAKTLQGWVLQETSQYETDVRQFVSECVIGYREIHIQSPNFPRNSTASRNFIVKRWAYYQSDTREWKVGWCRNDAYGVMEHHESSLNGECTPTKSGAL